MTGPRRPRNGDALDRLRRASGLGPRPRNRVTDPDRRPLPLHDRSDRMTCDESATADSQQQEYVENLGGDTAFPCGQSKFGLYPHSFNDRERG